MEAHPEGAPAEPSPSRAIGAEPLATGEDEANRTTAAKEPETKKPDEDEAAAKREKGLSVPSGIEGNRWLTSFSRAAALLVHNIQTALEAARQCDFPLHVMRKLNGEMIKVNETLLARRTVHDWDHPSKKRRATPQVRWPTGLDKDWPCKRKKPKLSNKKKGPEARSLSKREELILSRAFI